MTALALAARRGDAEALVGFVRAAQPDVWRFCAHLVGPDDAADLTQETFVRALEALPRFEGRSSARTWLLAIARHTCADWIRRRQRRSRAMHLLARGAGTDTTTPSGWVELGDLLAHLEPDRRAAFVLTQVLGLSYAEASEVCQCPVGTIRSRVARARLALLGELDETEASADVRGTNDG